MMEFVENMRGEGGRRILRIRFTQQNFGQNPNSKYFADKK